MNFKNPPIVEVICEFRFSQDSKSDPTIPGLLYEKLKTDFPIKESKIDQEIEITAEERGVRHGVKNPNPLAAFFSQDRKSLIQIGTNKLSIHHLKPYPGWEHFRPKIQLAFDALNSVTTIQEIDRIALVYIDKIEIAGHHLDLKQYFNFMPYLGDGFPEPFTDFMMGCDFPYNNKRDICKLQLTSAMPDNKANSAYLLTTEYFLAKKSAVTKSEALGWVENAHTVVHGTFLNCITKKLEDQFERIE
jgi:uncharacterized protein (TIGR04255 family)